MEKNKHKFPFRWTLKDSDFKKNKGTVFSCFSCGGCSTMGYKLAGFDVIGCNEIDHKMMEEYIINLKPKYNYLESIRIFNKRTDLPKEFYELDILDGSPPCSSFSMAGNIETDWGKEKVFREGQSSQILDTLFFDFIDLAEKLKPKVVISENVTWILLGNSKKYVYEIHKRFNKAGYSCQHFTLDSSVMGIPQKRKRVFFICLRNDLIDKVECTYELFDKNHFIDLNFNENIINFKEIYDGKGLPITDYKKKAWEQRRPSDNGIFDSKGHAGMKKTDFNHVYIFKNKPMPTITGKAAHAISLYDKPIKPSNMELTLAGSFPIDYQSNNIGYLIGMSVPPIMIAQISSRIYEQWISKF